MMNALECRLQLLYPCDTCKKDGTCDATHCPVWLQWTSTAWRLSTKVLKQRKRCTITTREQAAAEAQRVYTKYNTQRICKSVIAKRHEKKSAAEGTTSTAEQRK